MQVGLGGQVELVVAAAGPVGAHPDLAARLLAGDVQRAPPGLRPLVGDLEQQRRLAHARIAGEQRDRTGHHAAAEHPVELIDAGRAVAGAVGLDGTDRNGGATPGCTERAALRRTALSTATSSTVPQVPHSRQRPTHLAVTWRHSEQRYCERALATP